MSRCTLTPISAHELKQKVYVYLVYQNMCQSQICKLLKKSKSHISEIVSELEKSGVVVAKKGSLKPKFYEKGPTAIQYDSLVTTVKKAKEEDLSKVHGGVVNFVSKDKVTIPTIRAHELNYELQVLKEGDYEAFEKKKIKNNTQQMYLKVPHNQSDIEGDVNVELFLTYGTDDNGDYVQTNVQVFMHVPQIDITVQDHDFVEKAMRAVVDASNYLEKHHGWRLGDVYKTKRPNHFGVILPFMQGLTSQNVQSSSGEVYSSDSDKQYELETHSLEVALVMADLPENVYHLKQDMEDVKKQFEGYNNLFSKAFDDLKSTKDLIVQFSEIHSMVAAELTEANTKTDRILMGMSANIMKLADSIDVKISQDELRNIDNSGGMYQ